MAVSVGTLIRRAGLALREAGVPDWQADVRILVCAAAGLDRVALLRDPDLCLDAEAAARVEAFLARRLAREPVARILGRREFWGLDLIVTPAVLDPRPDTETLVSAALERIGQDLGRPCRILDLGTGSGAVLCALLSERPGALGWGIDRSLAACSIARANLARSGLASRSLVVQGSWSAACRTGAFDLVVSNPPYIETAAIAGLEADVRDHDPRLALDGGPDGLEAYRAIVSDLPRLLGPGGSVLFEVGAGQAAAVAALLAGVGLTPSGTHLDLAGIERVVGAEVSAVSDPPHRAMA